MHEISECEQRLQEEEGPVVGSTRRDFDENKLLPCHYFDYMYGTSTGGLISVMLARLRMTVPQCLEIYRRVGHELFGHRRNVLPLATKYHHKPLEKAVQDIVSQYCKQHDHCDDEDKPVATTLKVPNGSVVDSSASSSGEQPIPTERICQS
jgi:hypothetical protein